MKVQKFAKCAIYSPAVKKLIAVCLLIFPILACAMLRGPSPVPEALLKEDPFDAKYKVHCDTVMGKTVCVMTGNALPPFSPRYPMLTLGLVSEEEKNIPTRYFLRIVYVGEGNWLDIRRGNTLHLLIDGESVELGGEGSRDGRFVGEGGKVYEVARYEASRMLVKKIAAAGEVSVGLSGNFLLEKRFGMVNKLYFHQFVQHYIEKAPAK